MIVTLNVSGTPALAAIVLVARVPGAGVQIGVPMQHLEADLDVLPVAEGGRIDHACLEPNQELGTFGLHKPSSGSRS